mgnify:CR=1 FL=1
MGLALWPKHGGILGLVLLITEKTAEVEADLQHYYGLPLADLFTGLLSFRRLLALVRNLPEDSAIYRSERGPWGLIEQLLAALVDETRVGNWQRAQIHTKERLKPPKPIDRPGIEGKQKPKMTSDLAAKLLARGPQHEEVPNGS